MECVGLINGVRCYEIAIIDWERNKEGNHRLHVCLFSQREVGREYAIFVSRELSISSLKIRRGTQWGFENEVIKSDRVVVFFSWVWRKKVCYRLAVLWTFRFGRRG